ncbi:MAG: hypothetical protein IPK82_16815 [Polyangiaceae bacterium]|nr:hypothetical protein [Polyangiaceae bacterium]
MPWSPAETEQILHYMRQGASVQTGGSRCHSSYYCREGTFYREDFDEGATYESPVSEATLRALIQDEPELFREVLRAPLWKEFTAAFNSGDLPAARAALPAALELGDPFDYGKTWMSLLDWPATPLPPATVTALKEHLGGFTAYHLFMAAAAWKEGPETAARGLWYCDLLERAVGVHTGVHYLKAAFYRMANNLPAAEEALVTELRLLPEGDSRRIHFETLLSKLSTVRV